MDYILKHKDIDCGYMSIDEVTGEVTSFHHLVFLGENRKKHYRKNMMCL